MDVCHCVIFINKYVNNEDLFILIPQAIKAHKTLEFGKVEVCNFKCKYYVYSYQYEYNGVK